MLAVAPRAFAFAINITFATVLAVRVQRVATCLPGNSGGLMPGIGVAASALVKAAFLRRPLGADVHATVPDSKVFRAAV